MYYLCSKAKYKLITSYCIFESINFLKTFDVQRFIFVLYIYISLVSILAFEKVNTSSLCFPFTILFYSYRILKKVKMDNIYIYIYIYIYMIFFSVLLFFCTPHLLSSSFPSSDKIKLRGI